MGRDAGEAALSQTQIDSHREQLIEVLWAALQPPDAALAALAQFRQDVEEANRRLEQAEGGAESFVKAEAWAPPSKMMPVW